MPPRWQSPDSEVPPSRTALDRAGARCHTRAPNSARRESMEEQPQHRTLIVANLTASTPFLLQEVTRLATERPTKFSLLVPNVDLAQTSDWSLETAEKLLERAAGARVKGSVGSEEPLEAIREAFASG